MSITTRQPHCAPRRLTAAVLLAAAIVAGPAVYAALATQGNGKIVFTAMQADVAVDGEFAKFAGDVDFDPAKPNAGRVNFAIDVGSVATGSADADQLLRGKDFFDAAHFPQATFVSKTIVATAADRFQAIGEFTLKGRSHTLGIPFAAYRDAQGVRIEGTAAVSRLAYKVGEAEWSDTGTLADQVQIKFSLRLPR